MSNQELNVVALALKAWLDNWEAPSAPPTPEADRVTVLKTTEDIVAELSDMVETDTQTVASMMAEAGHKIVFSPDNRHGWALTPKMK